MYTRVSTEQQVDGYSLDNQEHDIEEYCKKHGYEIVARYTDEGVSGKNIQARVGLRRALTSITEGEADGIIVWKMSRLSRNVADTANISELLKKSGGFLISIKDNINTSDGMGQTFAIMSGVFAQMERDNIIAQLRGGMREKARKGEWNGGMTPLGYDLKDKALIVNSKERDIIIFIFNEYLKGNGYMTIAKKLNELGYKTKKNKAFSGNSVKLILMNITYAGKIRWGKLDNWSQQDINGARKRKYSEEVIEADGVHEAIIDLEVFEKVQELIENNPRHHVKQFKGNHILSGLLRCPTCGYGMSIQKMNSKGREYYYYSCNQYINKKSGCTSHLIPQHQIEEQFYEIFERIINDATFHDKILEGLNDTTDQIKQLERKEKVKTKEKEKLEQKQNRIIDEMFEFDDKVKDVIKVKLQGVVNEIGVLEGELKKLEVQIKGLKKETIDIDEVSKILKSAGKVLKLMPQDKQKEIIRKLITKIEVEKKSIKEIHFSFQGGFGIEEDTVNPTISK